ncbi:MAG: aminoacyl-histidine dipeptidase [Bacteroidales bacterium]|nr:aminoacyl-histidine dipeptidase [Bacteroidales bacterium]
MSTIKSLKPELVWNNFYELTQIPRPSKKEEKAIAFAKSFGEKLGLETIVDEVGNVIIRKPATPGMEKRMAVVLQGHLDMVPQKNADKKHDFEKDPIETIIDGEWVTANGTTLGADNGIGAAAAMAILQDKSIKHGPVEVLLTIDEETGMTGAFELKPGVLKGDILLNLDSEDEGELYIGCAGGMNSTGTMKYKVEAVPANSIAFKLSVTGLKGGHSGLDINLGRGNANKLMNRFLWAASELGLRLSSMEGGSLRNAIPREAFAVVVVPSENKDKLLKLAKEYHGIFSQEYASADGGLKFEALPAELPSGVMDKDSQAKLIKVVYGTPNGVLRMSADLEGIVETSTNLAIVNVNNGEAKVMCLLRSSVDSAKISLGNMTQSVMELGGMKVVHDGTYPGWKPNVNSVILKTMKEVYQKKYGKIPEVKVIHAGLECGIIGATYPGMELISFGPTIRFPHSPDEKVNIATVGKFYEYLVETLAAIPEKK